jgi:hypothetical protein
LTVGKKTSHPDPGLPKAAALKQSATAQRMTGRYNVEGRATVDHIKVPSTHRGPDEVRHGLRRAQVNFNNHRAEVRRRARDLAHPRIGAENENGADGLRMLRKLRLKGLHESHVDFVLRRLLGRRRRRRWIIASIEGIDHRNEALREGLCESLGRVPDERTLDSAGGAIAHTD